MKCSPLGQFGRPVLSLPTRGAWIEITLLVPFGGCNGSLPTRGAWIEIPVSAGPPLMAVRRSPHGERGLKCTVAQAIEDHLRSLPTRGAWIEITFAKGPSGCMGSLPHRGRGGSRLRRPEQKKKDTTEGLSPIGTQCGPMGLNAVYGERAILWSICRKIALNLLGCLFEGTHNYFRATGVDEHSTP